MELRQLLTLMKVVEHGSYTRAAEVLFLSQSAVSQQMAALERELGVALLQRHPRGVVPTPAGKVLARHARRILDLAERARQEICPPRRTGAEVRGELRIGASTIPGEYVLPDLIASFAAEHPGIRISTSIADTDRVLEALAAGQVDIAFVGRKPRDRRWRAVPFGSDQLVVVVPPGHPWASVGSIAVTDLMAHPMVARERGSATRRVIEERLKDLGIAPKDLQVHMEIGSNRAVVEAVLRGGGFAILSRHAVRDRLSSSELVQVPIEGVSLDRDLYIVAPRSAEMGLPLQCFLRAIGTLSRP